MNAQPRIAVCLLLAMTASCNSQGPATREGAHTPAASETHREEADRIHLSEDGVRDLRLSTATVATRTGSLQTTVLGEIAPDQAHYAEVAPPIEGQIVRVLVEADAPVRAGTPLARLRSAELGRTRAALLSATARRELASQTLERKRSLAGERIVSQREVQEADAAFRAADADARAAATALNALGGTDEPVEGDASLFVVRAPIAGRVIERRAILGQFADSKTVLFTVADLSRVWVVAQAFERDAVNVRAGSVAHITLAAMPGDEFDGRVALVGRRVDAGSRTVPIRIELSNQSGAFRPGMSTSVRLEVSGASRTILAVPAAALQRVGDRWLAFVPKGPLEYEMRPVGRGWDLGNEVEVVSGLRSGETVVVEGAFLLKAEAEKRLGGGDEHEH